MITFEQAAGLSASIRSLGPFEHTDLRPHYPNHSNLYDPKLQVMQFRDCLVSRDGFVKLATGEIISDLGYPDMLERSVNDLERDNSEAPVIEKPILLIGGHNNYYHWHLNWLPRVMLSDRFEDLRSLPILIQARPANYVLDSLYRTTGRVRKDIETLSAPVIRLKNAFVPTMFVNPIHAPFAMRGYNHLRQQRAADTGRKIYISRAEAPLRRVINEADVTTLLTGYGFETVVAENLDYDAQTVLFSQASHIVGAHGAGLTNMLFCSPNFSTIEIFNAYFTRVYWSLSQAMGGRHYRMLHGTGMVAPKGESDPLQIQKNSDFRVNLDELRREVEFILTK